VAVNSRFISDLPVAASRSARTVKSLFKPNPRVDEVAKDQGSSIRFNA
jgi:hypothetical protein